MVHPSAGCCAKLPRVTTPGVAVCEARLSLIARYGDKRDYACAVRAKAVYEHCFIRSLERCCD